MNKAGITFEGGPIVPADDGCEESPRCLTCPLAVCKHDDPEGYQLLLRRRRAAVAAKRIELGGGVGMPRAKAIEAVSVEIGISGVSRKTREAPRHND